MGPETRAFDAEISAYSEWFNETCTHYKSNHLLARLVIMEVRLLVAEVFCGELLTLPLHPSLSISYIDSGMDII